MTFDNYVALAVLVLVALGTLWSVYQNIKLKKDVTVLSAVKEAEELYDGIRKLLDEIGVDNIEDALIEIGVLKGTVPTPEDTEWVAQQAEDGSSFYVPAKPAVKK